MGTKFKYATPLCKTHLPCCRSEILYYSFKKKCLLGLKMDHFLYYQSIKGTHQRSELHKWVAVVLAIGDHMFCWFLQIIVSKMTVERYKAFIINLMQSLRSVLNSFYLAVKSKHEEPILDARKHLVWTAHQNADVILHFGKWILLWQIRTFWFN